MAPEHSPCSLRSQEVAEPLAGTAALASTWLCIEQPGPWGADALTESRLDPELGAELARRAKGTGVRIGLIRRPGRTPEGEATTPAGRQVLVASTRPGATWLERAVVADVEQLLDLDFAAVGAGHATGFGTAETEPVLLVCTNGRRDRCCAQFGRPVAMSLAERHGEQVWECTHTGGHRFAPTGVVLPSGYLYGRLDVDAGERLLAAAAARAMVTGDCRGRSTFTAPAQVAELAVRERTGETSLDAVTVSGVETDGPAYAVAVRHVDGRAWRVRVESQALPQERPASCGREPETAMVHRLVELATSGT